MKIKALIAIAAGTILLAACGGTTTAVSSTVSATSSLSESITSVNSEASSTDTKTVTADAPTILKGSAATYTVNEAVAQPQDGVEYSYPQIEGGSLSDDLRTTVNASLKSYAESLTTGYEGKEELKINGTYEVYLSNENVISVLYKTTVDFKDEANSSLNYATLTIDLSTGNPILLEDLYTVDEDFLNTIFTAYPDYKESMLSVQTDEATFIEDLKTAGKEGDINAFYVVKEDEILLITPVSQVDGSFKEFPVSYDKISSYAVAGDVTSAATSAISETTSEISSEA